MECVTHRKVEGWVPIKFTIIHLLVTVCTRNRCSFFESCKLKVWDSSCARALSDVQESAQFLAGEAFPQEVLRSLLAKSSLATPHVGVINTTPYEGHLEQACLHWKGQGQTLKTLSISTKTTIVEYCEQTIAMELLEDSVLIRLLFLFIFCYSLTNIATMRTTGLVSFVLVMSLSTRAGRPTPIAWVPLSGSMTQLLLRLKNLWMLTSSTSK